jgi:hypothetical protein
MNHLLAGAMAGAAAGAAGTSALNLATYLDMVIRARPASSTPEKTVQALSERSGIPVPGSDKEKQNRIAGLGPLTGLAAGLFTGAALGAGRALGIRPGPLTGILAAAALAMTSGNGPMTALGVTDPRTWSAADWASDLIPHLAYGVTTDAVLRRLPAGR